MRNVFELSEEELEDCVDGSTSMSLIQEIIQKPRCVNEQGYIDEVQFAQWFSFALAGFIDADEDTSDWEEANENNYNWGWQIAENINDYLDSSPDDSDQGG